MDWWTFGLQAINFLVLIALLQHFLYRPVVAAIDRRRAELAKLAAAAQDAKAKAQQAEADWLARQAHEVTEHQQLRRQMLAEASRTAEDIITQARQEAAKLLDQSRTTLRDEREVTKAELQREAAGVAAEFARSLLAQIAPRVGCIPFLEMAAAHLADQPPAERLRLSSGHAAVLVEIYPPLAADLCEQWRQRLASMLGGASVEFREQPELIAGVRLVAPVASIELSWAEAVARAEREMREIALPA